MTSIEAPRRRSLRAGAVLVVFVAVLAEWLPLEGPAPRQSEQPEREAVGAFAGPAVKEVFSIELPYEEPHVPPGPHQEQFTAACRLCHSPRLVLTQPRLDRKKWNEVVGKMIHVYGAPISPDQAPNIVAYLMAVHGKEP